jgi:hypothetical protein
MSYIERAFTVGAYTVEIVRDEDAQSPADYGDDSMFLAYGTRSVAAGPAGYARNGAARLGRYHVFTLGVYDGPYTILTLGAAVAPTGADYDDDDTDDDDSDDSGPGYVYVSRAEWPDAEAAERAAECLVNEWNDYLSGNVYGYRVKDSDGDTVDSCWGYTGDPGDPDASGVVTDGRASAEAWVQGDADYARNERAAGNDPADPATRPADGDSAGPAADE